MSFSEMLEVLGVSSSFLTYHVENLGELVSKTDAGKYGLSSFGEAAMATMTKVEDIPITAPQQTRSRKVAGKSVAIALGITCMILVVSLIGAFAYYVPVVDSKSSTISSLNSQVANLQNQTTVDNATMANLQNQIDFLRSQIAELENKVSTNNASIANLQNHLDTLLNLTGANIISINQINNDPGAWENKTVVVEGNLSGGWGYFTAISYYYVLSSNGTIVRNSLDLDPNSIGVNLRIADGGVYDYVHAVIIGVVKKGFIGNLSFTNPTIIYYIEEETILLL
jgi:hypothetical protein